MPSLFKQYTLNIAGSPVSSVPFVPGSSCQFERNGSDANVVDEVGGLALYFFFFFFCHVRICPGADIFDNIGILRHCLIS